MAEEEKNEDWSAADYLLRLEQLQAINFAANATKLADVLVAYDGLYKFTINLKKVFWKSLTNREPLAINVLVMLYQFMRQDLIKAGLAWCSGYENDSTFHTRRIIETSAVFIELVLQPTKLPVYADLTTQEARLQYVKDFMIFKLVKANLSKKSVDNYELLCLLVHPSFVASGRTDIEDNKHVMRFFDTRTDAQLPALRSTILAHLAMIYNAFKDLKKAFESDPDFDQNAWDEVCNQFLKEYDAQVIKMIDSGSIPPLKGNEPKALEVETTGGDDVS